MWTIFNSIQNIELKILNLLQYCFCFMFWFFDHEACRALAPWPGIEPMLHVLEGEVQTTRPLGKPQEILFFFFLLLFLHFNWRLITLQYFDGFCHTGMNQPWVYMCPMSQAPLPPPSASYPYGLTQCTSFESPISWIKLKLVIYFTYGNMQVSMLFSQIIQF